MRILKPVSRIRRLVYKVGFRPKQGSPFYSPSLALIYGAKEGFVRMEERIGEAMGRIGEAARKVESQHPELFSKKIEGVDFDGETDMVIGDKIMQFKNYKTDGFPDFNKMADDIMKPISIFGPDQMVSRHPDIPDQEKWMALNEGPIEPYLGPETTRNIELFSQWADDQLVPIQRHYLVTPRKHGRSQAMMKAIEHNIKYGKGSVAYIGPGMTIKVRPNPHPVGTDAWHLWNLKADTVGHAESLKMGPQGLEGSFLVYVASQFVYDAQKVANDVRTLQEGLARQLDLPLEVLGESALEVPEELLEDPEDDE